LRTKHSLDRRNLLQSDWYRERWPKPAELTSDQNVKTLFSNSSSAVMLATTMLGAGTGLGGNCVVGESIVETETCSSAGRARTPTRSDDATGKNAPLAVSRFSIAASRALIISTGIDRTADQRI
jgi:hypothetical protein